MSAWLTRSLQDNPRLSDWLSLEVPGRVMLRSGKVELGQGIHTALVQIAAEELALDPDRFDLPPPSTRRGPDEWLTASSQSVESGGMAIRVAAARLREAALAAAARLLNREPSQLNLQQGEVLLGGNATGHDLWSLSVCIDWQQDLCSGAEIKPAASYRLVGRSLPRRDLPGILTGGVFLQDLTLPGMLHGRVLHPPRPGATLASVPTVAFRKRFGDRCRLLRRRDFVAVLAADETVARLAADFLAAKLSWRAPAIDLPEDIAPWLKQQPARLQRDDPIVASEVGSALTATYTRGFLLHASVATSCAVARMADDRLHVWCHSQGLFLLRAQMARVLGLPDERIVLEHRPSAGCYGHNGADDAALEAAMLAMAVPGRPVRVLWSRGDEMSAICGSAMAIELKAGLDGEGRMTGWQATVWSGTHTSRPGAGGDINLAAAAACDPQFASRSIVDVPEAVGAGALRNVIPLYDLPAVAVRHYQLTKLPLRTSSLRALGAHPNVFAIECFIDELAHAAGCDPLDFRLRHLTDPRAINVLKRVSEIAGWRPDAETGNGNAQGLALARYKNRAAYCAIVAEVELAESVKVRRVWCAVDAGIVINPDGARNQIDGGIVQSLSWCLKEAVRSDKGAIAGLDWDSYPILRFSEVPEIITELVAPAGEGAGEPMGVGEVSQGPATAAVCNAASRALGTRLRHLPLTRERILKAL
ncbi:MAG: xanthine dehydrogenase family protein molybdopterin-binding subunit [Alphaproteobacteria bacterium]|nr:xanthine dehydrogenase family protein molybdopterin-binding subunit [Alphaproteobacteria bacterium]